MSRNPASDWWENTSEAKSGIESSENRYNVRRVYPCQRPIQGLPKHSTFSLSTAVCCVPAKRSGSGFIHEPSTPCGMPPKSKRVGRGLYRLATAPPLSNPDLVPIAIRIPRATVCLISALAHHGLTTQVPHAVDIALPSHAQIPKVEGVPLRVFWYPEASFSTGVELITIDDVPIRIYSPEKTIADCFKYRNKIGLDVAIEALRAYRERTPKPNRAALTQFAQINRVQKIMRPYLEAIL